MARNELKWADVAFPEAANKLAGWDETGNPAVLPNPFQTVIETTPGLGAFNGVVNVIKRDPVNQSHFYVGGDFTEYNSIPVGRIAKIHIGGALLPFAGTGFDGTVTDIAIRLTGSVLVCGAFTTLNGTACDPIVSLSSGDGSDDGSLVAPIVGDFIKLAVGPGDKFVAIQTDGEGITGFLSYGVIDTAFDVTTAGGFDSTPAAVAFLSDGRVAVAGDFTTYAGVAVEKVILLNPDASRDVSFTLTLTLSGPPAFEGGLGCIHVQPDDRIIVGGASGSFNPELYRLNLDGTEDEVFITNFIDLISSIPAFISSIVADPVTGDLFFTGLIVHVSMLAVFNLVGTDSNGNVNSPVIEHAIITEGSFALASGVHATSVLMGGDITGIGTPIVPVGYIAKFNRTTGLLDMAPSELITLVTEHLIKYADNYHGEYDNRTLVDKEYVDLAIAAAGGGGGGGTTFTAENGLTLAAGILKLGGELTEDTILFAGNNYFDLDLANVANPFWDIYFENGADWAEVYMALDTVYLSAAAATTSAWIEIQAAGSLDIGTQGAVPINIFSSDDLNLDASIDIKLVASAHVNFFAIDFIFNSTVGGVVLPRMITTQRDAIVTPLDGTILYNTTTSKFNLRQAGAWIEVGGGGGLAALREVFRFNSSLFTEDQHLFRGLIGTLVGSTSAELTSVSFEARLDASATWTALADITALQTWITSNISGSASSGTKYWIKTLATYGTSAVGIAEYTLIYTPT